jgi:LmbE family N-acetylglucosaminyl deacetylase
MQIKNQNILIVCAHLDDEIFSMGGILAKLSKNNTIHIYTYCHGLGGQDDKRILRYYEIIDEIKNNLNGDIEGVVEGYDDLSLEKYTTNELYQCLENEIKSVGWEPDIIFTHKPDTHNDHVCVSEIVDIYARNKPVNVFHFGIPGNIEVKPELFIDITGFEKIKKKFIKKYEVQTYKNNHPLSPKKIKARDAYYGGLINVDSAEIFEVKKINL